MEHGATYGPSSIPSGEQCSEPPDLQSLQPRLQVACDGLAVLVQDASELHGLALLVAKLHVAVQEDVTILTFQIVALNESILVPVGETLDFANELTKFATGLIKFEGW